MEFRAERRLPTLQYSNAPFLHCSITPIPNTYGFTEKTAQSENQQTQTAQEASRPSPQEAHLAEVGLPGGRNLPAGGAARLLRSRRRKPACATWALGFKGRKRSQPEGFRPAGHS